MFFCIRLIDGKAVALTESNFDQYVASHELVFLNFYADWCRFSQILAPTFDEAASQIATEYPQAGRVLFGKVDAVQETNLASRFKITKYPTLKLIRNGKLAKREYRGQRSIESLTDYIRGLLKNPIVELQTPQDLEKIDDNERAVVLFMQSKVQNLYDVYLKVAMDLRDDCKFYTAQGFGNELTPEKVPRIVFKPSKTKIGESNDVYDGALLSYDEMSAWTTNRCIPLVREITFENAEELAEEGLPFLILFHRPEDTESPKMFTKAVQNQLLDDRTLVNFLIADGIKFAHPLHHLGKTEKDLPLIAIDSFRHMYQFQNFNDIHVPGKLKEFVLDLFSGKLHREFHYGPDDTKQTDPPTDPPESTFKKLAPSRNRYTLLKDEL